VQAQTIQLGSYPTFDASRAPKINSREYALYDVTSGRTLFKSSSLQPVSIASTTKLMTAYLAIRHLEPADTATISQEASHQPLESSLMGVHNGEKISVQQLLYGALLVSGNDSAYALAEEVGEKLLNQPSATSVQKVARFVKEMNAEAALIGMEDTSYKDPVGINDEGKSTAVDLAKLMGVIYKDPTIRQIIGTPTISFNSTSGYHYDLPNSNRLVADWQYAGIIGGKTGYTDEAGHCLINAATQNGHTLVAVILHTNAETNDASAIESKKLLDAGFALTRWQ
jgi:D-alanyl-D-alanine carboxypeptidase